MKAKLVLSMLLILNVSMAVAQEKPEAEESQEEIVLGMDESVNDDEDFESATAKYALGDVQTSQCTGHVSIGDPASVELSSSSDVKKTKSSNAQQQ